MTISVIIITYKRLKELKETIQSLLDEQNEWDELILIDNHSEDGTKEYGEEISALYSKMKFFSLEENLGVAGGRNFGVQKSAGDVLVFLDDDAVFAEKGYFSVIREKVQSNLKIGALAFRVINFYTGQMRTEEMPFTDKKLDMSKERLTSTFIGAGHAIRKEVFEKCGFYPEDYFYGVEELDLSFRIIDAGYEIVYFPSVEVLHKQVNAGRVSNQEKWIMSYRNRMLTAYKYLPTKYVIGLGFVLFGKISILSRGILAPLEGIRRYRKKKGQIKTEKINEASIYYLKKNYGRLWI